MNSFSPKPRAAFALLELLLVLAVIGILAGYYFGRGSGAQPERSTYEMSVRRSQDAACTANRAAFRTNLEIFRMNNPGTPVSAESLQKAGITVPNCPDGGTYTFAADGRILCSKHDAPGGNSAPGGGAATGAVAGQVPTLPVAVPGK